MRIAVASAKDICTSVGISHTEFGEWAVAVKNRVGQRTLAPWRLGLFKVQGTVKDLEACAILYSNFDENKKNEAFGWSCDRK